MREISLRFSAPPEAFCMSHRRSPPNSPSSPHRQFFQSQRSQLRNSPPGLRCPASVAGVALQFLRLNPSSLLSLSQPFAQLHRSWISAIPPHQKFVRSVGQTVPARRRIVPLAQQCRFAAWLASQGNRMYFRVLCSPQALSCSRRCFLSAQFGVSLICAESRYFSHLEKQGSNAAGWAGFSLPACRCVAAGSVCARRLAIDRMACWYGDHCPVSRPSPQERGPPKTNAYGLCPQTGPTCPMANLLPQRGGRTAIKRGLNS